MAWKISSRTPFLAGRRPPARRVWARRVLVRQVGRGPAAYPVDQTPPASWSRPGYKAFFQRLLALNRQIDEFERLLRQIDHAQNLGAKRRLP